MGDPKIRFSHTGNFDWASFGPPIASLHGLQPMSQIDTADSEHTKEMINGERFAFGANWRNFLESLTEERMAEARRSLCVMLGVKALVGKRFLDVGCGSGLFSLAARQLGAVVYSFDYDPESVRCAKLLKQRFFPEDNLWIIEEGSVLDEPYMRSVGEHDIVYSWGVLHHTGAMWRALEQVCLPLSKGGHLFIAIYNDQGFASRLWEKIKKLYCSSFLGRIFVIGLFYPLFFIGTAGASILQHGNPIEKFTAYRKARGMSVVHDWKDWLGGYPFEYARADVLFAFFKACGLILENIKTTNRLGCNQFVFRRVNSNVL
jgi:2-polyprenyl-6-hydroxyphenyl methylase/3-demethylubiquinone-9 3-methyltransferase